MATVSDVGDSVSKQPQSEGNASITGGTQKSASDSGVAGMSVTSLFFQLVIIMALVKLNAAVQISIGFSQYFAYFFTIWYFWLNSSYYNGLFASNNTFNKLYYLIRGIGIFSCAMNVDQDWTSQAVSVFGVITTAMKWINSLVYLKTWVGLQFSSTSTDSNDGTDSKVKSPAMQNVRSSTPSESNDGTEAPEEIKMIKGKLQALIMKDITSGSLYFLGSIVNPEYRQLIWWIAVISEPLLLVFITYLRTKNKSLLSPGIVYFAQRVKSFFTIIIGFNIWSLIKDPSKFSNLTQLIVNVGIGFMILFFIKLLHFDVNIANIKKNPHKGGTKFVLAFMTLTAIVSAGVSLMGAGLGSLVTLASFCIEAKSSEELFVESTLIEGGDRRIDDFQSQAIVHRRWEESEITSGWNDVVDFDVSTKVKTDIERDESLSCHIYDVNRSQQLFVFGFTVVIVAEALHRLVIVVYYEGNQGTTLVWKMQFVCMLLAGPLIIFLYEVMNIQGIMLLSWGFGISLSLVIINLLDEIITMIEHCRPDKRNDTVQETGLITDGVNKENMYVIENIEKKGDGDMKQEDTNIQASKNVSQGVTLRTNELIDEKIVAAPDYTTTNLFFHLIFTGSLKQLGGYLSVEEISYLEFVQYLTSTYFFWLCNSYYYNIFGNDDIYYTFYYAIFSLLIIYMAMFQCGGWNEDGYGTEYGVTAGILRTLTVLAYLNTYRCLSGEVHDLISEEGKKIYNEQKNAMKAIKFFMLRDSIVILMWFLGAGYVEYRGIAFWTASSVDALFLILVCFWNSKNLVLPYLPHFNEQIMWFMLALLALAMNGIALSVHDAENQEEMYIAAELGFLIIYCMMLVADGGNVFNEETHPMNRPQYIWCLIWLITVGVAICGISLVGAGGEASMIEIRDGDEDVDSFYTKMYKYGLSLFLVSMLFLRLCHKIVYKNFPSSKCLYWFQVVFLIFGAVSILYVKFPWVHNNYDIMFYFAIVYGAVALLELTDNWLEKKYREDQGAYDQLADTK